MASHANDQRFGAQVAGRTHAVQAPLSGANLSLGLSLGQGEFLAITGLLGTNGLVLTESRSQERVTYRKR